MVYSASQHSCFLRLFVFRTDLRAYSSSGVTQGQSFLVDGTVSEKPAQSTLRFQSYCNIIRV